MRRKDNPKLPLLAWAFLNVLDMARIVRARRWGVAYDYLFVEPNGEDLNTLSECVAKGQLVPVVGTVVNMRNIEEVRAACGAVFKGKGSVGKTVLEVIKQ